MDSLPRTGRQWIALGAAGLAVLAALLASRLCEVAEEDAFIYYRYALNAVHGLGFAFNPPVRVEGFSSPLWMFLLTGVAGFAQDLHVAARIAGLILGGAAVGATVLLARTAGLPARASLASGLCLALNFYFLVWSQSGLETPLYALLLIAAAGWFLGTEERGPAAPWRRFVGGALFGLAALGRPEGLLLAVAAALWLVWHRAFRDALLAWLPGFGLVFGTYVLWRRVYFGAWLPNTSMKVYPLHVDRSVPQAIDCVLFLGVLPFVALLAGWLVARRDRGRLARSLRFLGFAGLLLSFGFHFLAGGDYRPGFRYLIPGLPLVVVAAFAGLELCLERTGARRIAGWIATALLAGACVAPSLALLAQRVPHWQSLAFGAHCLERSLGGPGSWGVGQAEWIVAHAPHGAVVAYGQMGRAPYLASHERPDLRFIDTVGWVDRRVASLYGLGGKMRDLARDLAETGSPAAALELGRERRTQAFVDLMLACQPDLVLVEPNLEHAGVARLASSEAFLRRYRLIAEVGPAPLVRAYALAPGAPPRAVAIESCF